MRTFRLALAITIVWVGVQTAGAQSGMPRAEEVYQNIQVFNGLSADQLVPTMFYFRTALGVTCNHCHVVDREVQTARSEGTGSKPLDRIRPGWSYVDPKREVDTPTKQMARVMIRLVNSINKETFGGRQVVTCYTCHRGSAKPVGIPPAPGSVSSTAVDASAAAAIAGISTDELLGKFVAALGGADAIQKISTRIAKGTVVSGGRVAEGRVIGRPEAPLPVEIYAKAPGMRTVITHQGDGPIRSFSGGVGWDQSRDGVDPRHQARDMRADEFDAAKLEDPFFFAGQLKQIVRELRVARLEKLGGKETYVVLGRTEALPEVQLYFDKESGILMRLAHLTPTFVGRFPTQFDYADFRTVDGVKVPFRWTVELVGEQESFTYQMDQVHQNVPFDDAKFLKPAKYLYWFGPPKAPAKGN